MLSVALARLAAVRLVPSNIIATFGTSTMYTWSTHTRMRNPIQDILNSCWRLRFILSNDWFGRCVVQKSVDPLGSARLVINKKNMIPLNNEARMSITQYEFAQFFIAWPLPHNR
jgi:hypothetical protein